MRKKWFSVLAVSLIVATALTGCMGKQSSDGGGNANSGSGASSSKTKTITLKVMGLTPKDTEAVKTIVGDYQAGHPGVQVDFQIPPDNGAALLKTRFAAGDAPDIFYLSPADIPAWSEKLADLSNEPWAKHVLPEGIRNITVDGKKLGFPLQIEGNGIVYNKDLFAKAGITNVPVTLTELKQTAEKLKAAGIQPFGEAWKNWGFLMHLFGVTFAHEQDENGFIDQLNKGTKQIKDLSNINNFFALLDLTDDYGFGKDSIAYDFTQQQKDFASGKMAMIKQGTWYTAPLLKQNPNLNMGLFAVPLSDNASETKLMVASTSNFVINKSSEHLEESKKFLNWLHDNGQKYLVETLKVAPVFDDLNASQIGPLHKDMNTYIKAGKTYDNFGTELWPSGFNTDISKPLQAYIAGVATKDQTVKQLQDIWTQRLNK
ncbi:hypothetical protein SD70_00860 [Gordoniibacillus kamchatkensis]|uniref:ABC transporter substrate-binding protein n=1 Tax=Gordoniibacillus kamchatkensis TaxID=1590651 RepID=A0ABR5AN81_9BACL|nr:extracellular solute-binding protein [Paenibacillus sp. VKM B-2647]KIL42481.1 hypothetical protein SD70_00860 [Paenibacillus sp. VKM B-2647]